MVLREKDANALILRNFVDFSNKPNQYFITNLMHSIPEVLDEQECLGEAKNRLNVVEGIKLLRRKYKMSNIDISYLLILAIRGYKFRLITERVFLCEEKAIFPSFEQFPPVKPKLSDNFETKTSILNSIAECQDKEDEEIAQTLLQSIPELLEKSYGVLYTGRFLSINQWIKLKEKEGNWISEDNFRIGRQGLAPWMFGNILVLQARGWYLQEIPEKFKSNDYLLIKA